MPARLSQVCERHPRVVLGVASEVPRQGTCLAQLPNPFKTVALSLLSRLKSLCIVARASGCFAARLISSASMFMRLAAPSESRTQASPSGRSAWLELV